MRNLTITRTKSFVGCAGKVKIYITDPLAADATINGLSCRKLGDLKNGEEKTFSIGCEEAKVFVIADKLSAKVSNEFYPLPAGEEDVHLTGKNHFHPGAGNPFFFDGVTDETVLANRKKGSKKGILVLIVSLILGFAIGFAIPLLSKSGDAEPKIFSSHGMSITLPGDFKETDISGYTQCYDGGKAAILTLKEDFTLAEGFGDLTLEEYGALVLQSNAQRTPSALQNTDGILWFDYTFTNPENGVTYYYYTTMYKGSDAFWMVQFFTEASLSDIYTPLFQQWAQSVTFE